MWCVARVTCLVVIMMVGNIMQKDDTVKYLQDKTF